MILNRIWHLNFTDCFSGKGFALNFNNDLQTLSKPFLFSLLLDTLHLEAYYTCKYYIINASSEKELRYFLNYHYIAGYFSS